MARGVFRLLLSGALILACGLPARAVTPINLAHLDWLKRQIRGPHGERLATWQIYAAPVKPHDRRGPFRYVGAEGEGAGCVDDVARAALVYLRDYRLTGDRASLANAREALRFVHAMAVGDGTYYNFLYADGRLNRTGRTSKPGLNWWTARALWATVEGLAVFAKADPAFAGVLRADAERTRAAIAAAVLPSVEGTAPPRLMGGAADVSSVAAIALAEWQAASPNPATRRLLEALAGGIAACRRGAPDTYPYGAHLPSANPTLWHSYGAHMLHALALAGRVLQRPDLIAAACDEADHFTVRLVIAGGPLAAFTPAEQAYPQIAYGDETLTLGLLALDEATGDRRYGVLAGVMASWLTGDNAARKPMYDSSTGRVWDGLDVGAKVSEDSGAESTIEGLLTLLAIARHPELAPYVTATPVAWLSDTDQRLRIVRVKKGGQPFDLAIRENLTNRPLQRGDTPVPPYGFTLVERPVVHRRP